MNAVSATDADRRVVSLRLLLVAAGVGVLYIADVAAMPDCGGGPIDPGWLAAAMVTLAAVAVFRASRARRLDREAGTPNQRDGALLTASVLTLVVMAIGAIVTWLATGLVQAFDCTGGPTPPL
jgi:hypothetical protein